jgi:HK97 family phage prohead protease
MSVVELTRSVPFTIARAAADDGPGDGLTLDGVTAIFGRDLRSGEQPSEAAGWTLIDSWEGTFWERFVLGAFRKTLRDGTPMMQYDHGRHPLIGSLPIGTYSSMTEEDAGLHVVGRMTDNWLIQPVRDAIAEGGITGMSIRFAPIRDRWEDNTGKAVKPDELLDLLWSPGDRGPLRRSIIEAKLSEAGPVAWPAYQKTSVGVRASELASELMRSADDRRALRDALGRGLHMSSRAPQDELLRTDVARVLLARDTEGTATVEDAPLTEHPSDEGEESRTPDAPPAEAPVDRTASTAPNDAPPAAGHPSQTERERRLQAARQLQVTLSSVRK